MKRIVMAVSAMLFLAAGQMMAQSDGMRSGERRNSIDMTEVYSKRASKIAKELKLDEDTKGKFEVLYLDYQTTRHNAANPKGGNQEEEIGRIDLKNISDEDAKTLIERRFNAVEAQLAVDKEYYAKFLEFLSPSQLISVFLQRSDARNGNADRRSNSGRGERPDMPRDEFGGDRGGFGGPGF